MSQPIRAVYEQGHLRLLDPLPINVAEGEEIQVAVISSKEQTRAALGDLLVQPGQAITQHTDEDMSDDDLWAIIAEDAPSNAALSDAILEERRDGP